MKNRFLTYMGTLSLALATFLLPFTVVAATPQYTASADNNINALRITVSNADPYSMINFYGRQNGGSWTTITNVGQTDQNGYYTSTLYPGFNLSLGYFETYVTANGQNSSTITVNGNSGCQYYNNNCYNSLVPSQASVTVNSGAYTNVTFYTTYNQVNYQSLYIATSPNSSIATATISGNTLTVYGVNSGSTSVQVCSQYAQCVYVYITVSGYNSNALQFSTNNPVVAQGQNMTVYVTNNNSSGVYISSNGNTNVVSPTVSGNSITLYGNSSGSSTIVVCANYASYVCGTLYVTVTGNNNFSVSPTALPQPVVNQFYSTQLYAQGGFSPYYFTVVSGSLPSGLNLSSNGYLSGTPNSGGSYNFTVQARDNYNRIATQTYYLTVSGGSVLGSSTYTNGTLLSDNGTIYIVYRNTKLGFTNYEAFTGFGFSLNNVTYGSSVNLAMSPYLLQSSAGFHPWGTWIKNGNTVYFMHENGLIPIASYDVFLNNGGQDRLVVPANSYDFLRPMLSVMEYGDSRLR